MIHSDNFPACGMAALEYAARGWHVFPVPLGTKKSHKSAENSGGRKWGATTEADEIRSDWAKWSSANVGIVTGPKSGFFVVEADTIEGHDADGVGNLRALIQQHGPLPATIEAESPSGSWHIYFKWPEGGGIINSAGQVARGVDVRGDGGMVVAAPSVKPGNSKPYSWINRPGLFELADCPEWLLKLCRKPEVAKPERVTRFEIDVSADVWGEAALRAEIAGLFATPDGTRNAALNRAAFRLGQIVAFGALDGGYVASRLEGAAQSIGLDPDEIGPTIASGLSAGLKEPRGPKEDGPMPSAAKVTPAMPAPPREGFTPWSVTDPANIPLTRFVYGDTYAAGYLTVSFAAPKTGKSLLAMAEAIDAASGRGFLTGTAADPQRVLYFNAEDDQDVVNARAFAVLKAHGIPQEEIAGRFFAVSGVPADRQLVLIRGEKAEIHEPAFDFLTEFFRREDIALAVLDPLQDLSHSPETNEVFRALGGRIRQMAAETGVAVGLVHHTRKPSAGVQATLDDGRGGSALRGVARFNRLLLPMNEAEGAQAGVDDFRRYFRIAEAESNLAPPSSARNQWFEKIGVPIGNGGYYPTVKAWTWPEAFAGVTWQDARRVQAAIAERAANDAPPRESAQAKDWAGLVVAEVLGLDVNRRGDKARIAAMIRTWLETEVLVVERLEHGDKGKKSPFVFAGPTIPGPEA